MGRKRKLPDGMWDRNGVYYARFRAGGQLVRKRLSTNLETATEMLNDLRSRADREDFGWRDNDYPWEQLKAEFLDWAKQSRRDSVYREYKRDLAKFEEFTNIQSVRQIDQRLVLSFRDWRLGHSVTPRTVNKQVGTIRNALNKAVKWGRIAENPISGIGELPHDEPAKERRSLSADEVERIFAESPPHLIPVWRMYAVTGVRRDELVSLQFEDVDFEDKSVTIRAVNSKNKKPRTIPLDDNMLAMIAGLREAAEHRQLVDGWTPTQTRQQHANFSRSHVFVTKANTPLKNNLLRDFYAVCKKAGIKDAMPNGMVDLHSLRVTFTTLSLDGGAKPKAVQAILGHGTLALTMGVYARATDSAKREAVSSLPFGSASSPKHVLSVHNAHRMSTKEKSSTQDREGKRLA